MMPETHTQQYYFDYDADRKTQERDEFELLMYATNSTKIGFNSKTILKRRKKNRNKKTHRRK